MLHDLNRRPCGSERASFVVSLAVAAVFVSILFSWQADAAEAYVIHTPGPDPFGEWVIRFDTDDPGTLEFVGWTLQHLAFMEGIDFSADGRLWAYAKTPSWPEFEGPCPPLDPCDEPEPIEPIGLYEINPATGAALSVGASGLGIDEPIVDISFNPVDGQMYGLAQNQLIDTSEARLYTIDLSTGVASLDRTISTMDAAPVRLAGLATNARGTMYVHDLEQDRIYGIDGEDLTPLQPLGFDGEFDQGMTIDWSGTGEWWLPMRFAFPYPPAELLKVAADGTAKSVGKLGDEVWTNFKPTDIAIVPSRSQCDADLDGDSAVGPSDLAQLLGNWGSRGSGDLDASGLIDAADLALMLGAWGICL